MLLVRLRLGFCTGIMRRPSKIQVVGKFSLAIDQEVWKLLHNYTSLLSAASQYTPLHNYTSLLSATSQYTPLHNYTSLLSATSQYTPLLRLHFNCKCRFCSLITLTSFIIVTRSEQLAPLTSQLSQRAGIKI